MIAAGLEGCASVGWRELFGRGRADAGPPEPEVAPAAVPPPAREPEPDDPTRCPKRWMGKRCTMYVGHSGACQW